MQKKQPMLHLLSTHNFRVIIFTAERQKSRGFIKSSKNFPFGAKAAFTFLRQSRIMGRNDRPVYKEDEECSR